MRIRKTISFREEVLDNIDKRRGNRQLSTQVNEDYIEMFKIKADKKNKK